MRAGEMAGVSRCESPHRRTAADAVANAEKLVPIARPVEAYAHVTPR
jgi:hypothetical protein